MCDKQSLRGWDHIDPQPSSPKNAYELFMEKQKRHPDTTMWFIEQHCPECNAEIYTDGKILWCKDGCHRHGKRQYLAEKNRKESKDYMGFISDLIK